MGPVNSVVFGDFTGSEKIDNSVRTNALFFLIVVSNSFSLGDSIGGLRKNVQQFLGELLVLEVGVCVTGGVTICYMSPSTQQKHLGVGASCTVSIRFLHPKNKIKEVIPNQTASQKLSGLITQGKEEKIIRKEGKECIMFQHEDFGGQLVWALERYVSTNVEGPESAFFNTPPPQQQAAACAAAASSAAAAGGGNTQQQQAQEDKVEENLPSTIQDLIEWPHLDNDEGNQSCARMVSLRVL